VFPIAHTRVSFDRALTQETPPATRLASLPTPSTNNNSSPTSATKERLSEHHFNARTGAFIVISPNFSAETVPSFSLLAI